MWGFVAVCSVVVLGLAILAMTVFTRLPLGYEPKKAPPQ